MKNLLTQWEIEEKNLKINLIKNLLTQGETEEEIRKIGGNVPLIDRKYSGKILLIERKHSSDELLINRKLVELEDNTECASPSKLTKLVKKLSNLTRIGKEKPHHPISHSLTYFIKSVRWLYFHFAEGLIGLIDSLAMGKVKLKRGKVAVGFSG